MGRKVTERLIVLFVSLSFPCFFAAFAWADEPPTTAGEKPIQKPSPFDFDINDIIKIGVDANIPNIPETKRPFQVLMLDVDNDGVTDILKVGEDEIFMIRGDRNRFFMMSDKGVDSTFLIQHQGFSMGLNPTVIYGQLNRDDFPDLLVVNKAGKGWIFLNKEGKGFNALFVLDFSITPLIRLGDFNGDGLDDIVTFGSGQQGIKILLNDGEGHFAMPIERSLGGMFVNNLTVHDVNHDGFSDIILTLYNLRRGLEGRVLLNISQRLKD